MTCHWFGSEASIHRIGASGIVSKLQQQPPPLRVMRLDDRLGDGWTDVVISDDDGFITAQD